MGLTETRDQIRQLDKLIDAGRRNRIAGHVARERSLFRQRGELQLVRAQLEAAQSRQAPVQQPKKCPTCRGSGRAQVSA